MTVHRSITDINGNYRNTSRKKDGYIGKFDDSNPFPALVTAWYPSSQTIDVSAWTPWGQKEFEAVIVYGDFFQGTGTIKTPKLATAKGTTTENTWQTYRNPDQENPNTDQYVLDNHIEALVIKTSVGYAASSFRFITPDSPLLNNAKYGREIKVHDDGSVKIHDEDGNIQFTHPSGLNVKIGSSVDDIDLSESFPFHEKNVQDYNGEIIINAIIPSAVGDILFTLDGQGSLKIDHPVNSFVLDINKDGKLEVSNATTDMRVLLDKLNDIVLAVDAAATGGSNATALANLKIENATLLK